METEVADTEEAKEEVKEVDSVVEVEMAAATAEEEAKGADSAAATAEDLAAEDPSENLATEGPPKKRRSGRSEKTTPTPARNKRVRGNAEAPPRLPPSRVSFFKVWQRRQRSLSAVLRSVRRPVRVLAGAVCPILQC